MTSHPALLGCQLQRLEGQVDLAGGGPIDAVGVGSYAQDDVLLQRQPAAGAPARLSELTPPDASEALLFHAQRLPPHVSLENSAQPLRFRRWLFAASGQLPGFDLFQAEVHASLPPYLQRQIGTETVEEACFAAFLRFLRDSGRTDDRSLEPRWVARILGDSARFMVDASRRTGAARTGELTLVATNASALVAARLGGGPLSFTLLEGSSHCERCNLDGKSHPEALRRAHERARTLAISTSVQPGARWLELPSGEALAVGADFQPVQVALSAQGR